jgi:hypothetical protein
VITIKIHEPDSFPRNSGLWIRNLTLNSFPGTKICLKWTKYPPMKRSAVVLLLMLLAAWTVAARAQVVPSATSSQFSVTAGGTVSVFQPDYAGTLLCGAVICYPLAQSANQPLFGIGAFVDVKLNRWVQIEAEGRWQRFNQYYGVSEDNYLIGPRVPVYRLGKATAYAKALGGYSNMNLGNYYGVPLGTGSFTTFAFGGGVDLKLTKRLSLRAGDFEYQYYPWWGNSTLSPYGVSAGFGYKIF